MLDSMMLDLCENWNYCFSLSLYSTNSSAFVTVFLFLFFVFARGFKALKQTVKLYYKLGRYKEMMDSYRVMLTYIKSAVTRNYSEKCINNIMDFVSGSASQNFGLLQEFYQTTLKALEEAKNEVRKWFYWLILPSLAFLNQDALCPVALLWWCVEALVQNKFKTLQDLVWYWWIWSHD